MAARTRIGLRDVRSLQPNEEVWDTSVIGFAARRQRSEAVAYIVMFRNAEGRLRRMTIGRHGSPWTPDTARDEARRILGIKASGEDPAETKQQRRKASTMADLCDDYLSDAKAGKLLTRRRAAKKDSTLATDEGRIVRHIKPLLGRLPVAAVTRNDVEGFMHDVASGKTAANQSSGKLRGTTLVTGGRGTASRTVGLLGAIFTYAVRQGLRPDNPAQGVVRFADGRRNRRLTDDEYRSLGHGLSRSAETIWPPALAASLFLALTGWRSGEAIGLEWSAVDLERRTATLADTKTGRSIRPLSRAATDVLAALPRGSGLVFQPSRGSGRMNGFPGFFSRIVEAGALPSDITPHVLRHSFASVAGDLGYSESTIGALIGHKGSSMTSRYIHSADAVLLAAADAVAGRIEAMIAGPA